MAKKAAPARKAPATRKKKTEPKQVHGVFLDPAPKRSPEDIALLRDYVRRNGM